MNDINLHWARTDVNLQHVNFGDALSAIIVAGLSNKSIKHIGSRDISYKKLASIGTIGHNLRNGVNDIWGTGFDASINPEDRNIARYSIPKETYLNVLATRGRFSEILLRSKGIDTPCIYGDPGWFAKYLVPEEIKKEYELGVIVHISELETHSLESATLERFKRYVIPDELKGKIKIINTYAPRSVDGVLDKIREIKSCKRILSTSLHGLIMAEIFHIPSAWFGFSKTMGIKTPLYLYDDRHPLDHRFRDFYSGTDSHDYVLTYHSPRQDYCDYDKAMNFLDKEWEPVVFNEIPLFKAFPYLDIAHPSLMNIELIKSNLKDTIL